MRKLLAIAASLALGTTALACGGGDGPPAASAQSSPAVEPTPFAGQTRVAEPSPIARQAPTTQLAPTSDDDGFVSFTVAMKLFMVSHPAGWRVDHSIMVGVDEIATIDTANGNPDVPKTTIGLVFFTGVPSPQGYSSNVTIVAESIALDLAVAEYFGSSQEIAGELFAGYEARSQRSVLVAGREAIMADLEFDVPGSAPGTRRWRTIQTTIVDANRGWAISCGLAVPAPRKTCRPANLL